MQATNPQLRQQKAGDDEFSLFGRTLLEASLDPVVTVGVDGRVTGVNEATVKVIGVPRDELIGTEFATYVTEPEKVYEAHRQVLDKGFVTDLSLTMVHKSNTLTEVIFNASLYRDADGKVLGVFAVARDMTAQNKVHHLTKTVEKLAAAVSDLDAFSYSVSHDLRGPLRAVDGFSRILLEDYSGKLDAEGQRLLNVVRDNTMKMSRMIDDILAFSRAGRAEIAATPVNMEALVRAAIKELETVTAKRKVTFEVGALPQTNGSASMLEHVWTNLLDNAVKYTGPRSEAKIQIGAMPGKGETVYFVRDNGAGFDMQYAGKLFGVFQRLHGTEFAGTGIGLAIVKRIVMRHGGRVWAEGKLNDGATFYFSLPVMENANA